MTNDFEPMLGWIDDQTPAMVDRIVEWSSLCTGSEYPAGLDAMCSKLEAAFHTLSVSPPELVPLTLESLPPENRTALRIFCRRGAPRRVLLAGHFDTVYDPQHPFQDVARDGANLLRGPGVADMKGGLVVMMTALTAFESLAPAALREQLGWEVFLNPDEEIGSPFSRREFVESAGRNHLGLLFEPALPGGKLASSRKGSGNFVATVRGRAAHAGRDPSHGRNAIRAAADFVRAVDELNTRREGVFINIGRINGGGALNIVPDAAVVRYNVRTLRADDEDWLLDEVESIVESINSREGIHILVAGEFASPPKPASPASNLMLEDLAECARDLEFSLEWESTGGACDGNKLAAAGLPNIDNLGPCGGGLHSADEHIFIDSLAERTKLTALYLCRVASGAVRFPPRNAALP
jgi:glutamate carboxypeptidase